MLFLDLAKGTPIFGKNPTKSKWVWPGNATTTHHRPTFGRKRQKIITATWHPEDKKSGATSSLFPSGMIAKTKQKIIINK